MKRDETCCKIFTREKKMPTPAGKWGLRRSNTVYYNYLTLVENSSKITFTLRVSSESAAS